MRLPAKRYSVVMASLTLVTVGLLSAAGRGQHPTIDRISPARGGAGTSVTISGAGFGTASAVRFGAMSARFRIISSTEIRATVPPGAGSGRISVSAAGESTTTSTSFEVSPPNIVLILTDDQRFDEIDHMAKLQSQLVNKGIEFTQGYISDPLCCPSRATILTGQYSHTTGIYTDHARNHGGFHYFKDSTTIATVFQISRFMVSVCWRLSVTPYWGAAPRSHPRN